MSTPKPCIFCHDLRPQEEEPPLIYANEWFRGLNTSGCIYCGILLDALERTETTGSLKHRSMTEDIQVTVETNRYGCVTILEVKDGSHIINEVQVCSDNSAVKIGDRAAFRNVALTAGDESMWSFLRQCFAACIENHSLCRDKQDDAWVPTRLLTCASDSQNEGGESSIRLIDTAVETATGRYIALSHCWGKGVPIRTTTKNIHQLQEGISWNTLPRTFQDFFTVAGKLGVRYLWIDALCILQDDEGDWAKQSREMDKVYENALFTVAASISTDSHTPFLGFDTLAAETRLAQRTVYFTFNSEDHGPIAVRARNVVGLEGSVIVPEGPLERRGWAYQERILSTRLMDFCTTEVSWKCATAMYCEHGIITGRESSLDEGITTEPFHHMDYKLNDWHRVVLNYSERYLTYPTDRLPALSGVASKFRSEVKDTYIAGLWLASFPHCLGWYYANNSPKASVHGKISWTYYYNYTDDERGERIDLLDGPQFQSLVTFSQARLLPSTDNDLGELSPGGYIELQGKVVEAEWESDQIGCGCVRRTGYRSNFIVPDCIVQTRDGSIQRVRAESTERIVDLDPTAAIQTQRIRIKDSSSKYLEHTKDRGNRVRGKVTCLLLYTVRGKLKTYACVLLLSKVQGTENEYERVGMGAGGPGKYANKVDHIMSPSYDEHKTSLQWDSTETWQGWEPLGRWEDWKQWFEHAETRTLKLV